MRIGLIIFMMLGFYGLEAQETATISPQLKNQMNLASSSDRVEVLLKLDRVGVPSWCRTSGQVKSYLLKETETSQGALLDQARRRGLTYDIVEKLWIANVLVLEVYADELDEWSQLSSIQSIEKADEQQAFFVEPVSMESAQRAPGGTENGLEVVGARFMWQKGYTGRGQRILNFDTGIWPDHPSFGDRYMGNHQSLEASWMKYGKARPSDLSGSHGTHTNGTCVGLDTSANDTIGFAFNAYFIATDPIVDNAADIRTMWEISKGYEWAMDPDGDPSTDDAPDVINNSWGHTFDPQNDSVICNGFFKDVLDAVEAAGIVSVQSAGNSGPGAGTVGSPAGGVSSLVNNFSVGAVNGHNASYPIATFSSRGPSHCPDTGVISIKPEVVAPGVNVRSGVRNSDGSYGYANYQGTSMAGPHAAGLALLLMEAFPEATAIEIKEAMYYSAIDLGDPGEENTYGRGLINAEGAYNYLSSLYIPAAPLMAEDDFYVESLIHGKGSFTCDHEVALTVVLGSLREQADLPDGTMLEYGIIGVDSFAVGMADYTDGDTLKTQSWMTAATGLVEFFAVISHDEDSLELDLFNNQRVSRTTILPQRTLPYFQGFEFIDIFQDDFYVDNPDGSFTWDTTSVENYWLGSKAITVPHARYVPRDDQEDALITPQFVLPLSMRLHMAFEYSYQTKFAGFDDSLEVSISDDCGETWTTLSTRTLETLNSTDTTSFSSWMPFGPDDWGHDTTNLNAYTGKTVILKFTAHNQGGNNLYIDNLRLWEGLWVGEQEVEVVEENLLIYPNPAASEIRLSEAFIGLPYEVIDLSGRLVKRGTVSNRLDVGDLGNGQYIIQVNSWQKVYTGRFQILR